jgi:hypothetical protein
MFAFFTRPARRRSAITQSSACVQRKEMNKDGCHQGASTLATWPRYPISCMQAQSRKEVGTGE